MTAPDYLHQRADELQPGQQLLRGEGWWTVERCAVESQRISLPIVRLRCLDHRGEVREFTLPSDLTVAVNNSHNIAGPA